MFLIRFAIGTFSLALLGLAFSLAPPSSNDSGPTAKVAVIMNR